LQLPIIGIFDVAANVLSLLLVNLGAFPPRMLQERREGRHHAKEKPERKKEKIYRGVMKSDAKEKKH
jgi:hypothetical protein